MLYSVSTLLTVL